MSVYYARTEAQWKQLYGPPGIDIHNGLYTPDGIVELMVGNLSAVRPATPEEEEHVVFLKSIMLRTNENHAVTPLARNLAVTHHHGSHFKYNVGDTLKLFRATTQNNDESLLCYDVVVKFVGKPDFMVLESKVDRLCPVEMEIRPARAGTQYVQIGLSGHDHTIMHRRGYISDDHVTKNGGYYMGNAGCSNGDSGGGVFAINSRTVYGICCGPVKSMRSSDFKRVKMDEITSHHEPVLSCISPSTNFFPNADELSYPDDSSESVTSESDSSESVASTGQLTFSPV